MSFIKNLTNKANQLKEQAQDRIKANGGLEGILQKTSEKVDQLTEAAGEGIKKATSETKQYIKSAQNTAQEQGEEGFIGLAKTLGTKVGSDVSTLVRNGYEKIASSESIQNLKKEFNDAEQKYNSENPETPATDFSKVTIEHVFSMFFSGVKIGNEWTTSSQPNNPKNARLIQVTYIVNGQEWFNKNTQESGIGAFDLTLDFLSNQTGLSLLDKESAVELFNKTQNMISKLIEQLEAEEAQDKLAKEAKANVTVKKEASPTATVSKTPAAKKTPAKKTVTKVVSNPVEKSVATKTPSRKPATKTVAKAPATKAPVAKKTTAVKKVSPKTLKKTDE